MAQYKKYFGACQQKGTNAQTLRFDTADSVTTKEVTSYLCAGALAPLEDNRSVATVKCPLDGSVFARAAFAGSVCETCQLCMLGRDTLGLQVMVGN